VPELETWLLLPLIAGLVVGAWAIPWARGYSSEWRGACGRWLFISSLLLLGTSSLVAAAYRAAAVAPLGLTAGLLVAALLWEMPEPSIPTTSD